jgi:pimeloyl-ACP methyl ester carboxylesterase
LTALPQTAAPPILVTAFFPCAGRWLAAFRCRAWLGALLLSSVLSGCSSLDRWQREKLYRPTPVPSAEQWQQMLAERPELEAIMVPVGSGGEQVQLLRWPAQPDRGSAVRVLYLHGTFRHAFQNLAKAAPMQRAGLDVYLLDYRGWGASSLRVPDEASIHEDAWTAWQALRVREPNARWVVYGHSMGSAVAVRLAERLVGQGAYCALVLESAFTSFADVADAAAGWLGRGLTALGNERMDSAGRIAHVDPPVWFLHGRRDDTVPLVLGRALFDLAPSPKHWAEWPLGHSNLQLDPSGRYDAAWRDIAESCRAQPKP